MGDIQKFINNLNTQMEKMYNEIGMFIYIHPSIKEHEFIKEMKHNYPEHTVIVSEYIPKFECVLIPKKQKEYIKFTPIIQSDENPMEFYLVKKKYNELEVGLWVD